MMHFTEEEIILEARKYNTRKGFYTNSRRHYAYAVRNKLLGKAFAHIEPLVRYDKDKVAEIAKKYKNKTEFAKYGGGASHWALKHGIMDDICSHMEKRGNRNNKIIYSYEFLKENLVYVGQTYNPKNRDNSHRSQMNSSVYKFGLNVGYIPNMNILINDYVNPEEANRLEQFYLDQYIKMGWKPLNKAKPGTQGRRSKYDYYTEDHLHKIALKYYTRNEMIKSVDGSVYRYIIKNNKEHLLNHMIKTKESWSEERIIKEAKKYNYRIDFYKGNRKAYNSAQNKNILDKVCSHMCSDFIFHTEESVKEIISKYTTVYDFSKRSPKEYQWVCRNKKLNELCGHLIKQSGSVKPNIKISINGKIYPSYSEAVRITGKSFTYIKRRVDHKDYPNYYVV